MFFYILRIYSPLKNIAFSLSSLISCAGTADPVGDDLYAEESRGTDCISQASVRDYRVLDDSNLIVSEAARRKYHVVLSRRAMGLKSTWQIGFRSNAGRICPGFSDLVVDDGFRGDRIRIASVRRLTPEDEEDLLIRFGKIESDVEHTPPPAEVAGAEVEELD